MRIVPAHQSIIGMSVAGTVDADYINSWLTDGLPGYPARTTGNMSLTVTVSPAMLMDVFAVVNHSIAEVASISIGGTVTDTIATQPWQANGMPANWYTRLTSPVTVSSIVLGVTGNTDPVVVGELYAGLSIDFPKLRLGRKRDPAKPFAWEGEFSSLAPYDAGIGAMERVSGSAIFTEREMTDLHSCFLSQRNGNRPVLMLPQYPANIAWLCQFSYSADDFAPGDELVDGSPSGEAPEALFEVTVEVTTIPELRW